MISKYFAKIVEKNTQTIIFISLSQNFTKNIDTSLNHELLII